MFRWTLVVCMGGLLVGCGEEPGIGAGTYSVTHGPNSVVITNTIERDEEQRYAVELPESTRLVLVRLSGDGDADLYTSVGREPTVEDADCAPYQPGTDETCLHVDPDAALDVMVRGWQPVTTYSLQIRWTGPVEGVGTSP